jgi:uncharacterized protein YbjT (DUF2867 family)
MTIFVTGATGKLGPHVVRALVQRGADVRALVRDRQRARDVLPAEVRTITGFFADEYLVATELGRADSMLLLTPHGPDMARDQIALIDLAAKTGTRVVKVSGTSAGIRPDGPDACRQHYDAEQHLAAAGIPWAVVRPNGFMQTLLPAMAASVRQNGAIFNPLGTAGLSLVHCADLGDAIATVLTDPTHQFCTHVLTGPAAPTYRDVATIISEETSRYVEVRDISPADAGQAARARGLSEWEADHLAEMLAMFATGASEYVTDDLEKLTGRRPRSVADFVREHRDLFLP